MFTILRTDGSEIHYDKAPRLDHLRTLLGYTTFDVVLLGKANTPRDDQIMIVDDTGMLDHKPINPKATALYQRVAPGTPYSIHGDVVLTYDHFFGKD